MINSNSFSTSTWFVIANPTSGNKRFLKIWKEIEECLLEFNFNYSFAFTDFAKHEVDLVDKALKNGFRNIISVGGDGTLHNVVNGIMMQTYVKSSEVTIGVIPLGTGNDWIKTYNIPIIIKKAVEIIHQKKTVLQDVGVLKYGFKTEYFNNVAGIGYDAFVVKKLKKLKKFGSISYLIAGLLGMLQYNKSFFEIKVDDKIINKKCLLIVFGIGKYSGGGMQFTKDVNPKNGLLDITIIKDFSLFDLLLNLPKLYNGKIINHKKVTTFKLKKIEITSKNKETYFQADGELLGKEKVNVYIIPKAIQILTPKN